MEMSWHADWIKTIKFKESETNIYMYMYIFICPSVPARICICEYLSEILWVLFCLNLVSIPNSFPRGGLLLI